MSVSPPPMAIHSSMVEQCCLCRSQRHWNHVKSSDPHRVFQHPLANALTNIWDASHLDVKSPTRPVARADKAIPTDACHNTRKLLEGQDLLFRRNVFGPGNGWQGTEDGEIDHLWKNGSYAGVVEQRAQRRSLTERWIHKNGLRRSCPFSEPCAAIQRHAVISKTVIHRR